MMVMVCTLIYQDPVESVSVLSRRDDREIESSWRTLRRIGKLSVCFWNSRTIETTHVTFPIVPLSIRVACSHGRLCDYKREE